MINCMSDRLIALGIRCRSTHGKQSPASIASRVGSDEDSSPDDDSLTFSQHLAANEARFLRAFPNCNVEGDDAVVVVRGSELFASSLSYKHIRPRWYRSDGIMFDGEFDSLISRFEYDRGESHTANEAIWTRVVEDEGILRELNRFVKQRSSEAALRKWCDMIISKIQALINPKAYCASLSERCSGLGGALAFAGHPGAAYLSKVDDYYLRSSSKTPFIGIEYKHVDISENRQWYKINTALPQTLCALAGNSDCFAGLLLCDLGFTILWREHVGFDDGGIAIDRYFVHPAKCRGKLKYCFSADKSLQDCGADGRMDLLRILYEIVRSSMTFDDDDDEASTPVKIKKSRIVESASKPRPGASKSTAVPRNVFAKSTPQQIGAIDKSGNVEYLVAYGIIEKEVLRDIDCSSSESYRLGRVTEQRE